MIRMHAASLSSVAMLGKHLSRSRYQWNYCCLSDTCVTKTIKSQSWRCPCEVVEARNRCTPRTLKRWARPLWVSASTAANVTMPFRAVAARFHSARTRTAVMRCDTAATAKDKRSNSWDTPVGLYRQPFPHFTEMGNQSIHKVGT